MPDSAHLYDEYATFRKKNGQVIEMLSCAEIDNLIQQGYEKILDSNDYRGGCDLWLEAWDGIKAVMEAEALHDIEAVDKKYQWTQFISNYVQDLEMELANAGAVDKSYCQKRIAYCWDLLERCKGDQLISENTRRAIAESHFQIGDHEKCDRLYETWLQEDPDWGWGYIGWSDCYMLDLDEPRYDRAEEILLQGLNRSELRDREHVLERAVEISEKLNDSEKVNRYRREYQKCQNSAKLKKALEHIKRVIPILPEKEFACIRANREEAIPTLLEYVKTVCDMGEDLPEDYDAHTYAMFLLAEFKVNAAFPYLVQYLEYDKDRTYDLLSDTLTEDFGSILASVATTDDIPRLKAVVENTKLYLMQRHAALTALQALYAEDVYSREDYFAYLQHLLDTFQDDPEFLAFTIIDCSHTGNKAFLSTIEKLFEEKLVDEQITSFAFEKERLSLFSEEDSKRKLKQSTNSSFVSDALKAISSWICFKPKPSVNNRPVTSSTQGPAKSTKIGVNQPCPCGSGKKYKKCCRP